MALLSCVTFFKGLGDGEVLDGESVGCISDIFTLLTSWRMAMLMEAGSTESEQNSESIYSF